MLKSAAACKLKETAGNRRDEVIFVMDGIIASSGSVSGFKRNPDTLNLRNGAVFFCFFLERVSSLAPHQTAH